VVKEEINNLHSWIDQIWRKNCLLKRVIERKIEGKVEGTGIRGRRRKQLVDGLKENRRCCKLKDALNHTLWRNRFGRGYRPSSDTTWWLWRSRHTQRRISLRSAVVRWSGNGRVKIWISSTLCNILGQCSHTEIRLCSCLKGLPVCSL